MEAIIQKALMDQKSPHVIEQLYFLDYVMDQMLRLEKRIGQSGSPPDMETPK